MLRHRLLGEQGHRRSGSGSLRHRSNRPTLEGLEPRVVLSHIVAVGGTTANFSTNEGPPASPAEVLTHAPQDIKTTFVPDGGNYTIRFF